MKENKIATLEATQDGIGQEVIENVQGPATGSVPSTAPVASITMVEMMQFLMDTMQLLAGGSIKGCTKDGVEVNIPIPEAATTKDNLIGVNAASAPTGGVVVSDFQRAKTINLQDLFPFIQNGNERLTTFQDLSNAIKNIKNTVSDCNTIKFVSENGYYNCSDSTLNLPLGISRGLFCLLELVSMDSFYRQVLVDFGSGKTYTRYYVTSWTGWL